MGYTTGSRKCRPNYINIGNSDLIAQRHDHPDGIAPPGGAIGEYVPFYFGSLSPMLLNIKTGYSGITKRPQQDVVYIACKVSEIVEHCNEWCFTDGHAKQKITTYYNAVGEFGEVYWNTVRERYKNTAYLKIESFDGDIIEQKKIYFLNFIQSAFNRIDSNKVKNLIIDLRNNHGGTDEYGKLLFSNLIPHDFDYYSSLTLNTDSFRFFNTPARAGRKVPISLIKANATGSFDVVCHPNVGKQKSMLPTYTGKIYVLINGGCFQSPVNVFR